MLAVYSVLCPYMYMCPLSIIIDGWILNGYIYGWMEDEYIFGYIYIYVYIYIYK